MGRVQVVGEWTGEQADGRTRKGGGSGERRRGGVEVGAGRSFGPLALDRTRATPTPRSSLRPRTIEAGHRSLPCRTRHPHWRRCATVVSTLLCVCHLGWEFDLGVSVPSVCASLQHRTRASSQPKSRAPPRTAQQADGRAPDQFRIRNSVDEISAIREDASGEGGRKAGRQSSADEQASGAATSSRPTLCPSFAPKPRPLRPPTPRGLLSTHLSHRARPPAASG